MKRKGSWKVRYYIHWYINIWCVLWYIETHLCANIFIEKVWGLDGNMIRTAPFVVLEDH